MQVQDVLRKRGGSSGFDLTFSFVWYFKMSIFNSMWNSFHMSLFISCTQTKWRHRSMKKSTFAIEISLYTHSLLKRTPYIWFWFIPFDNSRDVHLNWNTFITYRDLLHQHLVPNITDTQCASSNVVLKEEAETKLVKIVSGVFKN